MPSKKIFFRCNRAFVHEQIRSQEAIEALGRGTRGIGAYFATIYSERQGTGLTDEEIKLLMPIVLGISVNDITFRKEVEKFFTEINTQINYITGREMEIGLEIDNNQPVTYWQEVDEVQPDDTIKKVKKFNTPLAFEQYVACRHALKHPRVAGSPEEAKGNKTFDFYFEDPELVDKSNIKQIDIKDNAMALFAMIKPDAAKVKHSLVILQTEGYLRKRNNEQSLVIGSLTPEERLVRLREVATERPEAFLRIAGDKKLKYRYQLTEFLRMGLLKEAGSSILVPGSGESLGATREQAIDNLYDNPEKNQLLATLKAQMMEKLDS